MKSYGGYGLEIYASGEWQDCKKNAGFHGNDYWQCDNLDDGYRLVYNLKGNEKYRLIRKII